MSKLLSLRQYNYLKWVQARYTHNAFYHRIDEIIKAGCYETDDVKWLNQYHTILNHVYKNQIK